MSAPLLSIAELKALVRETLMPARIHAQAVEIQRRESSNGKPFYELRLRDADSSLLLRAWNDTPAFAACEQLEVAAPVEVAGEFVVNGSFGLEARRWGLRVLDDAEAHALFENGNERADETLGRIRGIIATLADPRLSTLCEEFLREFGVRFARAAAARANHHARRGGLAEHTLRMMEAAQSLCAAYPELNRDLLLAGTLLHDCGKLWETCPPERGFDIPRDLRGELLGHITIGIEVVNALWRNLPLDDWKNAVPPSEAVRLHLLHLIAAHHGALEYGSPVLPKTPEAFALHAMDNLDARIEMFKDAQRQPETVPGVLAWSRPLNVHPAAPLPAFDAPS